jgi:2-polyprenyl-6-methoxyphenol hydroxylase-like FAD-dependent oxidoreductase
MGARQALAPHDVVIVGARAAGAATALLLARLGHDVVVVDRADLPSDTISTHQIARTGVVALRRWGLLDTVIASGAPAIRQVSFRTGEESVTRAVKDKSGVDCLVAPRRYVLDTLLAEAAARSGAWVRTGVTVAGVRLDDTGRATGIEGHDRYGRPVDIRARYVIGADGLNSRVAKSVGADIIEDKGALGGCQYAYFGGLPWPAIEFISEPGYFAGVFPTHDEQGCVWVCSPSREVLSARREFGDAEQSFTWQLERAAPELAERLRAGHRTSPVRGMLRAPNQLRQAHGPGWALVGDAGYHRDPVTGHGISDAFRDAELLAASLDRALCGDADEATALAEYQRHRDGALREVFDLTAALAAFPPVPEFVELSKRLGTAIDTEAAALAAQPVPGGPALVPA